MKKVVLLIFFAVLFLQIKAQYFPEKEFLKNFEPQINYPQLQINLKTTFTSKDLIPIWDSVAEFTYSNGELVLKQYKKISEYYYENGLPKIFYVFNAEGDTLYRYYSHFFDYLRIENFYTNPNDIFSTYYTDSSYIQLFDDGQWIDKSRTRHIKHPIYGDLWTFSMSFDYDTVSNQYTGGSLNQIFFDENNFLDYYIEKDFLASTEQWQNRYKVTYTVYDDGKIKSYIGQGFNVGTQTWFNDYKADYWFNEDGLFDSIIYYDWDQVAYEWIGEQKITFSYSDTLITNNYFYWDSTWIPSSRNLYYYNSNGEIIYQINQDYDLNSNQFINDTRFIYSYDENGNLIEKKFQTWNQDSLRWDEYSKYYYEYNNFGKMTLYLYQTWNSENQTWLNSSRYLYSYVDDTLYAGYLYQNWDSENEIWLDRNKTEYTYDQNKLVAYSYAYWDNSKAWITTTKNEYYWQLADVAQTQNLNFFNYIYPNPAWDYFYIPFQKAEVKIYTLDGKLIKTIETYNSKINISDLNSGLYVVEINANQKISKQIFLKK